MFPGNGNEERQLKMADSISSSTDDWEGFFQSLVDLLNDCETSSVSTSATRETIAVRLEHAVLSLQQILPLVPGGSECGTFLRELLNNFTLLTIEWTRRQENSTQCTNLAIYSLETPPVIHTGSVGRPRLQISEDALTQLRSLGFKWKHIADMLLVSRWTIRRRVIEFGLEEITGFTEMANEQLDGLVRQFIQEHGSVVGCSIINGYLRSLGIRIQRHRLRSSIARVDPINVRLRWAVVVSRRAYSVPGPNSLWHVDGHHSLVNWGFVVHGAIDGFSRCIVFLKCSTNNRSETVGDLFLSATRSFGWPSRVRTDHGGENVKVWELMEEARDSNRGSYLVGSSVHNQRIERLWRDVFCMVCHIFYYTFQAMEESGVLNRENDIHLFVLHFVFLPRINRGLERLTSAWNNHPIRTERNWSPLQIWTNGMVDIRNNSIAAVSDFHHGTAIDDLEWFGYDPDAPAPGDDGLSFVQVEDVNFDLPEIVLQELVREVDPLEYSDSFGIDVYQKALSTILTAMESHE